MRVELYGVPLKDGESLKIKASKKAFLVFILLGQIIPLNH
jgi:hypothetical protein